MSQLRHNRTHSCSKITCRIVCSQPTCTHVYLAVSKKEVVHVLFEHTDNCIFSSSALPLFEAYGHSNKPSTLCILLGF